MIYNEIVFFGERHEALTKYDGAVRIDRRPVPYDDVRSRTWPNGGRAAGDTRPRHVPAAAWLTGLLHLVQLPPERRFRGAVEGARRVAKRLGLRIDHRGRRLADAGQRSAGYAYTGDWKPERMPDMKQLRRAGAQDGHQGRCCGMPCRSWANTRRWCRGSRTSRCASSETACRLHARSAISRSAAIPRSTPTRAALRDWGLDGFKLDFIERFVADEQDGARCHGRPRSRLGQRGRRSPDDRRHHRAEEVNPDVMLEFRQPYIGPLIRKYGNMFRASDSPNAYLTNKVKSIDLRLLGGRPPSTAT